MWQSYCKLVLIKEEGGQKAKGPMQLRGDNHLMQGKIIGSWLGMVALHCGGRGVDDGSHCPSRAILLERV